MAGDPPDCPLAPDDCEALPCCEEPPCCEALPGEPADAPPAVVDGGLPDAPAEPEDPAEPDAPPDELDCEPSDPCDPDWASEDSPGVPPDWSCCGNGDSLPPLELCWLELDELDELLGSCCGNGDSRLELELELLEELVLGLPPDLLDDDEDDDGEEGEDAGEEEGDDGDEDGVDDGDGMDGGCGIDVDIVVSQPASASPTRAGSSRTQIVGSLILVSCSWRRDGRRAATAAGRRPIRKLDR